MNNFKRFILRFSQVEEIINHKTIIVKEFLKQSPKQPRFGKERLIR